MAAAEDLHVCRSCGPVLQGAVDDKVHVAHCLTLIEEDLLRHQAPLLHRGVADRAHCRGVVLVVLQEEGVPDDDWVVDLLLQLHLHELGQLLDEFHVAPHLPPRLRMGALVEETPDAHRQLHRDLVLPQVPPQRGLLLIPPAVDLPEPRHGIGDAADEGGEGDEGQDDDTDVEGPLHCVGGHDLHRGGRELRQRPMQRGCVPIADCMDSRELVGPRCTWVTQGPDPVPGARDEVVEDHDEHDVLEHLQKSQHVLGAHKLEDLGHKVVQLQQADQAHETQQPEDAPDPHVQHLLDDLSVGQPLEQDDDPVVADKGKVDGKPSPEVALGGLREARLQHAVDKVAKEEGEDQVERPVDDVEVEHAHHQVVELQAEGQA
mmetsp:Transcript_35563/g.111802  ORF Transcript_35563/g.111802 Transcript_35563/m.111802 type:complete len:375 (-) Transcript_35563:156-1280(-)